MTSAEGTAVLQPSTLVLGIWVPVQSLSAEGTARETKAATGKVSRCDPPAQAQRHIVKLNQAGQVDPPAVEVCFSNARQLRVQRMLE